MVCINTNNLPELLAPAGSFEHLKAAIKAGADAVYLGGTQFGARAFAGNFTRQELVQAIEYAHFYGKKLYLTVNTLLNNKELEEELYDFICPYYEAGLDGAIIQDLGVVAFLRKHFPDMELHASTQMTITSVEGAMAAKRMGICRIVPARELSLREITEMKDKTGLEIEVFIHGALCYCYSGQCLFSSYYGGRSGNRGSCAQPCRLPYEIEGKTAHYLSPKDLCSLQSLPQLIEAGMDSLKIEGRMKNTDYVAGVVRIYRKYLDLYASLNDKKQYHVDSEDVNILKEIFSRDGFTDGYFFRHNGKEMMSMKNPNHLGRKIGSIQKIQKNKITIQLNDTIYARDILIIPVGNKKQEEVILTVPKEGHLQGKHKTIVLNAPQTKQLRSGMNVYRRKNQSLTDLLEKEIYSHEKKLPVKLSLTMQEGIPIEVLMKCEDITISIYGDRAEVALGKPLTKMDVEKQFSKTGTVPFFLQECHIEMADNLFLPLSVLKKLRQNSYQQLEEALKNRGKRMHPIREKEEILFVEPKVKKEKQLLICSVYSMDMLRQVLEKEHIVYGICFPMDFWKEEDLSSALIFMENHHKEIKRYISLPAILRKDHKPVLPDRIHGCYVHNINQGQYMMDQIQKASVSSGIEIILGSSLYQWNVRAMEEYQRLFGSQCLICDAPMELKGKELEEWAARQAALEKEVLLYGHYPLMISAQCLQKNARKCNYKPDQFFMIDKKGRKLPVTTHCKFCYNRIWTDQARNWMDDESALESQISRYRLDFFGCNKEKVKQILKAGESIAQFNL